MGSKLVLALGAFLLLAGCDPSDLTPTQTSAVCKALVGPIKYNTFSKESQRYAAALLALDLKQRNQIGQRLQCPAYRAR